MRIEVGKGNYLVFNICKRSGHAQVFGEFKEFITQNELAFGLIDHIIHYGSIIKQVTSEPYKLFYPTGLSRGSTFELSSMDLIPDLTTSCRIVALHGQEAS